MKPAYAIPAFIAAQVVTLSCLRSHAQTWQTIDDFLYQGTYGAQAAAIAVDPKGGIYVAGSCLNGTNALDANTSYRAVVRFSGDAGSTWQSLDEYVYPGARGTDARAVYVDSHGAVFVGVSPNMNPGRRWVIRRSTDGGHSWETVDDYLEPGALSCLLNSFTSDTSGNIYAVGGIVIEGSPYWTLRKSTDGGTNWSTVNIDSGLIWYVYWTGTDLFVSGMTPYSNGYAGQLLRSADGGVFWSMVDTFSANYGGVTEGVVKSQDGTLYTSGNVANTNGGADWIIRQGQPDGSGWTTSNTVPGCNTSVEPITDPSGNIFVLGAHLNYTTGAKDWLTLRRSASTKQWVTSDYFFYDTGSHGGGYGTGMAADPAGDVFAVGVGVDRTPTPYLNHWLVRKLAAPAPTLHFTRGAVALSVSWPVAATDFKLEFSGGLGPSAIWSAFPDQPAVIGDQKVVTVPTTNRSQFFRLIK